MYVNLCKLSTCSFISDTQNCFERKVLEDIYSIKIVFSNYISLKLVTNLMTSVVADPGLDDNF